VKDAIGLVVTSLGDFPLDPDSGHAWLWSATGDQLVWSSQNAAHTFNAIPGNAKTHLLSEDRFRALAADLAQNKPDQLPVRVQQLTFRNAEEAKTFTCLSRAVPLRTGGFGILAVAIGAATRMAEPKVSKEVEATTNIMSTPEMRSQPRRIFRMGSTAVVEPAIETGNADRREARMRDLRQGLEQDFAHIQAAPAKDVQTSDKTLPDTALEQSPVNLPDQGSPSSTFQSSTSTQPWTNNWQSEARDKRRPLRFVWQTDAGGRFVHLSRELTEAVGPSHAMIIGQTMPQAAQQIGIHECDDVMRSMTTRDTWAARAALWPVESSDIAIPVEMAGMPVIEQGQFVGFRGYGIARIERAVRLPSTVSAALAADVSGETDERLFRFGPAAELPAEVTHAAPVAIPAADKPAILETSKSKLTNPLPLLPDAAVMPKPSFTPPTASATTEPMEPHEKLAKPVEHTKDSLSTSEREAFREIAKALETAERAEKSKLGPSQVLEPISIEPKPVEPVATVIDETVKAGSLQALKKDLAKRSKLRLGATSIDEPDLPLTAKTLAPVIPYDQARRDHKSRGDGNQAPWATIMDRLPLGLLVTQNGEAVYANRHMLELTEHAEFDHFRSQMATSGLFASNENHIQNKQGKSVEQSEVEKSHFTLLIRNGKTVKVEAHIQSTTWNEAPATLTSIKRITEMTGPQVRGLELDLLTAKSELRELQSVLDTATDGIISIDPEGRILGMNRSAEALFGFDQNELTGEPMTVLFEPESHISALDYLEGLKSNGVRSIMNDGRDVKGRERNGGVIPLFMTIGRVGENRSASRFCIVLRDITHWKKVESDLMEAKRAAEDSSTNKTDFLATISHEIRTPLNAIIGFSQVMMTESFGPIGNERYKQYAKDINASGEHVVSLVNDLLDLSKVASGKLDLTFASVDMNAIVAGCVAMIQPQANAGKVIVRSQLASHLPLVVADDRAVRQIVINLLSNAAKFTEAGGQVIASTSFTDQGEVVIRVRDTGVGMSEDDIKRAMEPFRQIPGPRSGGGTGLGLPLTKALVEANRAAFAIHSIPHQGTLVEVTFPSTRVLAE
jgi:PAS domain S-box-containing protein